MPLNTSDEQKIKTWMAVKFPRGLSCPACQQKNWSISEIVSTPSWSPNTIGFGGPTVPMVQMGCTHCGNVMFFAAVLMGLAS